MCENFLERALLWFCCSNFVGRFGNCFFCNWCFVYYWSFIYCRCFVSNNRFVNSRFIYNWCFVHDWCFFCNNWFIYNWCFFYNWCFVCIVTEQWKFGFDEVFFTLYLYNLCQAFFYQNRSFGIGKLCNVVHRFSVGFYHSVLFCKVSNKLQCILEFSWCANLEHARCEQKCFCFATDSHCVLCAFVSSGVKCKIQAQCLATNNHFHDELSTKTIRFGFPTVTCLHTLVSKQLVFDSRINLFQTVVRLTKFCDETFVVSNNQCFACYWINYCFAALSFCDFSHNRSPFVLDYQNCWYRLDFAGQKVADIFAQIQNCCRLYVYYTLKNQKVNSRGKNFSNFFQFFCTIFAQILLLCYILPFCTPNVAPCAQKCANLHIRGCKVTKLSFNSLF